MLLHQYVIASLWQTHQSQTSADFSVSIFHIMMIWSNTNVTQTIAWCNLSESRSEVKVQFSRVYLSISCNTGATCASEAKKTLQHICESIGASTCSCDLSSRRTSTLPSWKNSGWRGVRLIWARLSFLWKSWVTQTSFRCVCVCVRVWWRGADS